MQCEQAQDLLIQRWLGEIEPDPDRDLSEHLAVCTACQSRAAGQQELEAPLVALQSRPPLPPQRKAVLARLPGARRQLWLRRGALSAVSAAAAVGIFFAGAELMERLAVNPPPPATVHVRTAAPEPISDQVRLDDTFLSAGKPGAGPVATAAVPVTGGQATAYFYLEALPGKDRVQASVLLRHADGRLTRELLLGEVTFGLSAFTQPEFRLLETGGQTLLAVATDDPATPGGGLLSILAYDQAAQRLLPLRWDGGRTTLAVTAWPAAMADGTVQTRKENIVTTWTVGQSALEQTRVAAAPAPPLSPDILAEAALTSQRVTLQGSLTEGASLVLHRSDGSVVHSLDLGRPHFGGTPLTQPALRRMQLGDREVLAILSDPMVGRPGQAVLRIFAYDPGRGRLRLIPFTAGEVLVDQAPAAVGARLVTLGHQGASSERLWQLSADWLLEPIR